MQDQAPLVTALSRAIAGDTQSQNEKSTPLHYWLNIHDAPVEEAENLAAQFYGACQTRFLTNGSTQGIHALIMTACQPGDKILLPRNVHRSVLGGLILSRAEPIFVMPRYDQEKGLLQQVDIVDIEAALAQHPDCRAVLVVSPNYQGVAADLSSLAAKCHGMGIPLLVDEAHGPHFGIHPALPASALQCGADGAVQSTHKLIGALTQSSMVHLQGSLLNQERFLAVTDLLRPREASLLLLASLDAARRQMAQEGSALLTKAVDLAVGARFRINKVPGLRCFSKMEMGGAAFDPTKLTVQVSGLGITGPDADILLRQHRQIQAEYSDLHNLLFLITIGDTEETVAALVDALAALPGMVPKEKRVFAHHPQPDEVWVRAMSLDDAFHADFTSVPLAESIDLISHNVLCPYPPGIPVVYPGELLTEAGVKYLLEVWQQGIPVLGIREKDKIPHVSVVRQGA